MTEDTKFNKFVLSPLPVKRDIEILKKTPCDSTGEIGGDMTRRYNAVVDIIKSYL